MPRKTHGNTPGKASEHFSIVGVDGLVGGSHFQTAMPVVKLKNHNEYHVLIGDDRHDYQFRPDVFNAEVFADRQQAGLLTRIPMAVDAFSGATAIIVSWKFVHAADLRTPEKPEGDFMRGWFDMAPSAKPAVGTSVLVAFTTAEDVVQQRNVWAQRLFDKALASRIERFEADAVPDEAGKEARENALIRVALQTASYPTLKEQISMAERDPRFFGASGKIPAETLRL